MQLPRLSVITAVYNGEKYLAETVESVLNQTFSDFEYIIIDDCSTDNSVDLIQSFKDSRIKLLRNAKNERLVVTRNTALEIAKGEYVALTDQDDVSVRTRFSRQVSELDKNEKLGLVGSWFDLINAKSQKHGAVIRRTYNSDELKTSLMFRNPFCNSTVMVRRSAMASPPYDPNFPLCEDYNFIVNIERTIATTAR
jgi:glycosyltransferase involved in cell wall biosynthesis